MATPPGEENHEERRRAQRARDGGANERREDARDAGHECGAHDHAKRPHGSLARAVRARRGDAEPRGRVRHRGVPERARAKRECNLARDLHLHRQRASARRRE
jgi:hypothetical protein